MDHGENALIDQTKGPATFNLSYRIAAFGIGFALAGFFDGILLHQILQWHSLLSSLDGEIFRDLRFRMMTDGLFHAFQYLVAVASLALLWRSRQEFASKGGSKVFVSSLLVGFGAWHVIDAVLNHWILGLHHIKENENWLAWDVSFFALGIACVALGILLRTGRSGRGGAVSRHAGRLVLFIAFVISGLGLIAAYPWAGTDSVTVVFDRGMSSDNIVAAIAAVDGRFVWSNPDGDVWTIVVDKPAKAWKLYGYGAVFVSGSMFGMGCFSAAPAT